VVDPFWPPPARDHPADSRGHLPQALSIPAHTAFELSLIVSLIAAWSARPVRAPLLVALASHVLMRLWSAVDFIPKALAFERADPATIEPNAARRWSRRRARPHAPQRTAARHEVRAL
jgi:hypothetical protein